MSVEFAAPKEVYQVDDIPAQKRLEQAGYNLPEPLGFAKTRTGGLATWFPGHPYPRKTFIYPGSTAPNNKAKRMSLALFLPFANLRHGLKAFVASYLLNFNRLIDSIYADLEQIPYLHYQYYSEFGKNTWDFIYLFLKYLGFNDNIAYRTGLQIATMIEYDDAYLHRLTDVMNESVRDNFLKNPRKEILRLLDIYENREVYKGKGDDLVKGKFIKFARLVVLLLLVPKFKKAFKFAVENVDYENFKMDELDKYWTLSRADYNIGGKSFDERKIEMAKIMIEYAKKAHPDKDVRMENDQMGNILIKLYQK